MLHIFLITYDNYQYNFSCLSLWNVFPLYYNEIYPQSLPCDWLSSHMLRTRVHTLNVISVSTFIYVNVTIPWLLFLFRRNWILFLTLNIIRTPSLFIFILFLIACSCYVDALQLLILNSFVEVSNCFFEVSNYFVGAQFNSFGTYSNVSLTFNSLINLVDWE